MELCSLDSSEVSDLEPLLSVYPYNAYRLYRGIPKESQVRILLSEVQRLAAQGCLMAVKEGDEIVGLASFTHLPWDSRIFGLPMAKIGHLIAAYRGGARAEILDQLLAGLIERACAEGYRHLSTRVDCADVGAIHCLERRGFRLMECLVTYLFRHKQDILPSIKMLYGVRPYKPEDRDALLAIAERMCADHQSRISSDPDLPRDGVKRFYVEWMKNACAGEMADHILVAEKKGRPIGFLVYKLNGDVLKDTGVRIAGQGLSASLPEGTGSYVGLLKVAFELGREEYDFMEAEAPLHHYLVSRTWQYLGLQLVRGKYAFHRGIG